MTNYSVFVVDENFQHLDIRGHRHNFDGFPHFQGQQYSRTER